MAPRWMKSMTVHSGGVVILTDRAARVAQSLEEQVRVLEEEEGTIACVREERSQLYTYVNVSLVRFTGA